MPQPFVIHHDPAAVEDLRARLRATRWPDAPEGSGWDLGTDISYLRELVAYWADGYDFDTRIATLAKTPRYRVELDGLGIHTIHVPAASGKGMPLLLCHGWPDSTWRYEKVIPLLTDPAAHGGDPADAFDVIVPDMPGYGYSDKPDPVMDATDVAALWTRLMTSFGYDRFAVAGGDIGSHVARDLGLDHAERLIAVHRTDAGIPRHPDPASLTPEERAVLDEAAQWALAEGAYAQLQRTKPQTLATGLSDSPAGLVAWIVEKLRTWSDSQGDIESRFSKDEILDLLTIYWMTGTIDSSVRMYKANGAIPLDHLVRYIEVPSGFSIFAVDLVRPPRAWVDRIANVVSYTEPPRGGHFAAYEEPELYVEELRNFFRPFRDAG